MKTLESNFTPLYRFLTLGILNPQFITMRLILLGCLLSLNLAAQQQNRPLIMPAVNQFSISLIPSSAAELQGQYGFGLGIARVVKPDNNLNLVVGLEYNKNYQFKDQVFPDSYTSQTNVKYDLSAVTVPVMFRGSVGYHDRVFSEMGGYIETIGGRQSGDYYQSHSEQLPSTGRFDQRLDQKVNFGGSVGAGLLISWARYQMLFKAEARFGLNNLAERGQGLYNRFVKFSVGLALPQSKRSVKNQEDWDKAQIGR